ncbi:MAG: phosphopantothenate/pantothenate synthetase [Candidatus Hodarchaeales archaeon]
MQDNESPIPKDHPRYESLMTRDLIKRGVHEHVVAEAGLIAHGRGEAFDYLLGEKTPAHALEQEKAAAAYLVTADKPVISVNGNVAMLCPGELVELSRVTGAPLEINLFYRSEIREKAIEKKLVNAGADVNAILGTGKNASAVIEEISHSRRKVDPRGILVADTVFVPLEDGDRTEALRKMGKKIITVDLNPLSRTALCANVTIVNNITRSLPNIIKQAEKLKNDTELARKIVNEFDNESWLKESVNYIIDYLRGRAGEQLTKTFGDDN